MKMLVPDFIPANPEPLASTDFHPVVDCAHLESTFQRLELQILEY